MTDGLSFSISLDNPGATGEELANALAPLFRQAAGAYENDLQRTVMWANFTAGVAGMVCASIAHDRAIEVFECTLKALRSLAASEAAAEGRAH